MKYKREVVRALNRTGKALIAAEVALSTAEAFDLHSRPIWRQMREDLRGLEAIVVERKRALVKK